MICFGFSTCDAYTFITRNLNGKFYQIDLPPHPDMFIDANLARSEEENLRDDDGANQVFFGGERFLDGISGQAHVKHLFLICLFTCIYHIGVRML